jgi:hypothetical protein
MPIVPTRAARFLLRPRVLAPLLVVTLLVASFIGYGAWTRSRPVTYARGGDAFAVVPSTSPSTSPSASLPTAAPTPEPRASLSSPRPVLGSPTPGPVAATAAPGAPEPAAQPAPHARSAGLVLPRTGRYGLRVEGSEKVDFGPVSFCSQKLPESTWLVVSKAAGEGPTSFNFDVPFFPGSAGKHDERHVYRYAPAGVYLDYEIATVTCQGVRQSSDTDFAPPQLRVRLPLAVGAVWTNKGGDDDRTEQSSSRVARTETLTVAGQQLLTYVIETTTSFTGGENGSRTQTWWWSPTWAIPVKWSEHIDGHRSGAAYSEDVTVTVTSRP